MAMILTSLGRLIAFSLLLDFGVGTFIRRSGRVSQLAAKTSIAPIPVDFYVFLGSDGNESGVQPQASTNIGGSDEHTGFWTMCKDQCPGFVEDTGTYTSPRMRFCDCVAKLMVEDMNTDFGQLDPQTSPMFQLGDYVELDMGQDLFDIPNGHAALYDLLMTLPTDRHYRRSGRLAVWIANAIGSSTPHSELMGTTMMDQPLYADVPGAGVLLQAGSSRMGKRLSHEVGHVVGFHHVAGAPEEYTYEHSSCPGNTGHVEWKFMDKPSCEMNIMGGWYDGPYCCPFADAVGFLQVSAAVSSRKSRQPRVIDLQRAPESAACLPNDPSSPKSPYCCGDECTYACPEEQPAFTFATMEHKATLSRIQTCWLHLKGTAAPADYKWTPGWTPGGSALMQSQNSSVLGSFVTLCDTYTSGVDHCERVAWHRS